MELGREDVHVETLAGAPDPGDADGPGRDARFDAPVGIVVDTRPDPSGRGVSTAIYVADSRNHRIRVVNEHGDVTTLAGGPEGYADGPVTTARFSYPCGLAVGPDGALYIADTGNHRIRVVRNGIVATLAGGTRGFAVGSGRMAQFDTPVALCFTALPTPGLWVADAGNRRIRRVTLDGGANAGQFVGAMPVWMTPSEPFFASLPDAGRFVVITASLALPRQGGEDQTAAVSRQGGGSDGQSMRPVSVGAEALPLKHPGVAIPCPAGGYIATDATQGALLWIRERQAEVLAGGFQEPGSMRGWRDFAGNRALFGRIGGLAIDPSGRILVADTDANAIRRVTVPELMERRPALRQAQ
jgi:sugar lactone lactonase YvrE